MEYASGQGDCDATPPLSIEEQTLQLLEMQRAVARVAKRLAEAREAIEEAQDSNDSMLREELQDAVAHIETELHEESSKYDFARAILADAVADAVEGGLIGFDEAVKMLKKCTYMEYYGEPASSYDAYVSSLSADSRILIQIPDEHEQAGVLTRDAVLVPKSYGDDILHPVARLHFVGKTLDDVEEVFLERGPDHQISSTVTILPDYGKED